MMIKRFAISGALALLVALASHGASAAWTRKAGNGTATAATGTTCGVSQTLTAGDLIIVVAGYYGSISGTPTVANVTDSSSHTYTAFPGASSYSADGGIAVWYNLSLPSAASSITVTFSASVSASYCFVDDMESNGAGTGAAAIAPASGSAATGAGTTINPGSLTNPSGDLYYAGTITTTPGESNAAGWTYNTGSTHIQDAWGISAGSALADPFDGQPADWAAAIVGFTTTPAATCPKTLATLGAGC